MHRLMRMSSRLLYSAGSCKARPHAADDRPAAASELACRHSASRQGQLTSIWLRGHGQLGTHAADAAAAAAQHICAHGVWHGDPLQPRGPAGVPRRHRGRASPQALPHECVLDMCMQCSCGDGGMLHIGFAAKHDAYDVWDGFVCTLNVDDTERVYGDAQEFWCSRDPSRCCSQVFDGICGAISGDVPRPHGAVLPGAVVADGAGRFPDRQRRLDR